MARLGLVLIRVVVWATEQLSRTPRRPGDHLRIWAAHLGLGGVRLVGTTVDEISRVWAALAGRRPPSAPIRPVGTVRYLASGSGRS